eukprot:5406954-Amphidinium_carterae.1
MRTQQFAQGQAIGSLRGGWGQMQAMEDCMLHHQALQRKRRRVKCIVFKLASTLRVFVWGIEAAQTGYATDETAVLIDLPEEGQNDDVLLLTDSVYRRSEETTCTYTVRV